MNWLNEISTSSFTFEQRDPISSVIRIKAGKRYLFFIAHLIVILLLDGGQLQVRCITDRVDDHLDGKCDCIQA